MYFKTHSFADIENSYMIPFIFFRLNGALLTENNFSLEVDLGWKDNSESKVVYLMSWVGSPGPTL